jgi:multiple antibiotic resistance protein
MTVEELINYLTSLIVILNPLSALPALLNLTQWKSPDERRRIGVKAGIFAGVILVIVTWVGRPLLQILGISLPAFQCAGGIVVFSIALSMLNAQQSAIKQTPDDQKEAKGRESIAIVPLAIPLMAGPGAISTVIFGVNNFPGVVNQFYLTICAMIAAFTLCFILYFASPLGKVLGQTGINIFNRLGGLILAALAINSIAKGLIGLFPVLKGILP